MLAPANTAHNDQEMETVLAAAKDPLRITALVERTARITWGARSLGPLHPLPEAVNDRFAGYYADQRRRPR